jgi:hypothetical protein
MDRLNRTMAGCGLSLLLVSAGGCRSTRHEVPPGRPYTSDGRQAPPINFSNDPHPMTGPGIANGMGAPGGPQYGTPSSAMSSNHGAPTGNQYGPPGTAMGGGQMPSGPGFSSSGTEPTSMPPAGLGAPSVGQETGPTSAPSSAP